MDARDEIRRLIRGGKVSEEEGGHLLDAFETLDARDRVIREELAAARSRRPGVGMGGILSLGVACIALGALIHSAVVIPTQRSERAMRSRILASPIGQDPTVSIDQLEHRTRQSGSADDYWLLAGAYEQRYQQSGSAIDRQRAAEAQARAERLERRITMRGSTSIFGMVFVLVVVTGVVIWIMLMYNGLAKSDERVNERWAQVEAVLQRRLDLIPQLAETVKGYAAHERDTLLAVTEARAKALGVLQAAGGSAPKGPKAIAELNQAQQAIASGVQKLLALAEQYPDLKASANFVTLQDQLEGTENRISVERQRYNDGVRDYNARLRIFPSNVIAGMFGFEPRQYFESKLGAEEPVPVKF